MICFSVLQCGCRLWWKQEYVVFWRADYVEYADSFLNLRNPRELRGKYVVSWHADYAEYADFFCICWIYEICVGKVWCFGTQITQNTQIFYVSAESARSVWGISKAPVFVTFLSKLCSSPLIIQCGSLWRKQDSFVRCYIFGPCGSLWACVLRGDVAGCAGGIHSWPSPPPQWLSWPAIAP